jgi:hypothetical protein
LGLNTWVTLFSCEPFRPDANKVVRDFDDLGERFYTSAMHAAAGSLTPIREYAVEMLELLVSHGGDINLHVEGRGTPLQTAIKTGNIATQQWLAAVRIQRWIRRALPELAIRRAIRLEYLEWFYAYPAGIGARRAIANCYARSSFATL